MSHHVDVWFVMIGGLGTGDDATYITTRTPPAAWSPKQGVHQKTYNLLSSAPNFPRAAIKPMATWGSDGTAQIDIVWESRTPGGADLVRPLLAGDAQARVAGGAPIRISRFAEATGDFHSPDAMQLARGHYFIGGECVDVEGDDPNHPTIIKAHGRGLRGTLARRHPVGEIGPSFYLKPTTFHGQPVRVGRIAKDGSEEQVFIGTLDSVSLRDGKVIRIVAQSITQALADREVMMPTAKTLLTAREPDGFENLAVVVDRDLYGEAPWKWMRVVRGDDWVIMGLIPETRFEIERDGRRYWAYDILANPDYNDNNLIRSVVLGYGSGLHVRSIEHNRKAAEFTRDVFASRERVEYVPEVFTISQMVEALLASSADHPYGASAEVDPMFIGAPLGRVDGGISMLGLQPEYERPHNVTESDALILPLLDGTYKEVLRDLVARPAFIGIAVNSEGQFMWVDWLANRDIEAHEIPKEAMRGSYTWATEQADALTTVMLRSALDEFTRYGGEQVNVHLVVNHGATDAGLRSVDETLVPFLARWLIIKARADLAVDIWGVGLPLIEIRIAEAPKVDVGYLVAITRPDMPMRSGARGESRVLAIVIERATVANRMQTLRLVVVRRGDVGIARPTWAPCATVTDFTAPWATVASSDFTDPANTPSTDTDAWRLLDFDAGERWEVDVCDSNGKPKGIAAVVATDVAGSRLEIDGTAEAGDVLILRDYDFQSAVVHGLRPQRLGGPPAWGTGANGRLGVAEDPGQEWS